MKNQIVNTIGSCTESIGFKLLCNMECMTIYALMLTEDPSHLAPRFGMVLGPFWSLSSLNDFSYAELNVDYELTENQYIVRIPSGLGLVQVEIIGLRDGIGRRCTLANVTFTSRHYSVWQFGCWSIEARHS